jgi:hypothetical protein
MEKGKTGKEIREFRGKGKEKREGDTRSGSHNKCPKKRVAGHTVSKKQPTHKGQGYPHKWIETNVIGYAHDTDKRL